VSDRVFSRRTVTALVALCAVSLAVGLALVVFQEEIGVVTSAGPDAFSYSALGQRGFVQLLEGMDFPVLVSRTDSARKVGRHGVLVVAEPDLTVRERQQRLKLAALCRRSPVTLLVLPKRRGLPDAVRPTFVASVSLVSLVEAGAPLDALGVTAVVARAGHSRRLHWDAGPWPGRPFADDVQLVRSADLEPLVACSEGVLLGRVRATSGAAADEGDDDASPPLGDVYVLSDPDVLANHGLGLGGNAELALRILDRLDPEGGPVVFDETLHGHEVSPSVVRSFFRVPLVFLTLQVLLTAGALLWLANARFGSPQVPPPARGRGLEFLVENTAELLAFGGHGRFVLGRYFQATVGAVCRRLHLDLPRTGPAARRRLANISAARSGGRPFADLETAVRAAALDTTTRPQEILALARDVHRWQQEMTHGS